MNSFAVGPAFAQRYKGMSVNKLGDWSLYNGITDDTRGRWLLLFTAPYFITTKKLGDLHLELHYE